MCYFLSPHIGFLPTSVRRGVGFFPPDSDMGDHQGSGGTVKFGRYFSFVGIAMCYFLYPTLDFSNWCKEESWIFSTWQRHRGSPGEGCTLKFGCYFSLLGIAKSYFLSPPLGFYHECQEGVGLFHLTATWGLTRGGVHPKIWALFFLGGHCQELFFKPPIGFLP